MAEYKRKDMPEDMIVRISPGRNTITVQECSANGVVSYREIDPIEFYFALNGSCISNVYQRSGFLPEHCLHISMNAAERHYVIWNPELRADVIYRDTEYRSFPLPRLVFGLRVLGNGKVADCSMGVVADEAPTEDTPMFFYPFSNVYEDDRVCTGNNVLPRYKKLSALKNFPRYLLGLPDNDDKLPPLFHSVCFSYLHDFCHPLFLPFSRKTYWKFFDIWEDFRTPFSFVLAVPLLSAYVAVVNKSHSAVIACMGYLR